MKVDPILNHSRWMLREALRNSGATEKEIKRVVKEYDKLIQAEYRYILREAS